MPHARVSSIPSRETECWTPQGPDRPARGTIGLRRLPRLTLHRVRSNRWTGPRLRIAVLSDPHLCRPWVTPEIMARVVAQVQALDADIIVLGGDYLPDRNLPCRHLSADEIAPVFTSMQAPLGVHGMLGNHDWRECPRAQATGFSENSVLDAFASGGLPLMRNEARHIVSGAHDFWIVALDSQRARADTGPGLEDPDAAFAGVPAGASVILLAHEPDYFALGDPRPVLQISGHTHGGQGVLFGRRPMTPSAYGDRYAIGHITEDDRHLVVSAGLGYSGLPLRIGVPPELTLVELSGNSSIEGEDP